MIYFPVTGCPARDSGPGSPESRGKTSPVKGYLKLPEAMVKSAGLVCVLLLGALLHAAEERVTFSPGPGVELETIEMLREYDRFLGDLFPRGPLAPRRLLFEIGAPAPEEPRGKLVVPLAPGPLKRRELSELVRAGEALLRSRGFPPAGSRIPRWIAGAFRQLDRARNAQRKYFFSNGRFPAVEALLRKDLLPEPEKLLAEGPSPVSPAETYWFDDCAGVAARVLRRSGFRGTPAEAEETLGKMAREGKFHHAVSGAVWTALNPLCAELTRKELDALRKVSLPALEESGGQPAVKAAEIPLRLLPAHLEGRPDRERICSDCFRRFEHQTPLMPPVLRPALRLTGGWIRSLGRDPGAAAGFKAALDHLEYTFGLYRERSELLDGFSDTPLSAARSWHGAMEENGDPGTLLAPDARRALLEIEKMYTH